MIIILIKKKRAPTLPRADMCALWIFSLFSLGYFLKSPALASSCAVKALGVCAAGLIPSLFPFIVLVGIINSSGLSEKISAIIGKPIAVLFGIRRCASLAVLLGALGGFPIGAICTRELYERGEISKDEAERLCAFTNNAGPAFCIGTIGSAMLNDAAFGLKLYISQLAAAFVIGIFSRQPTKQYNEQHTLKVPPQSVSRILTSSITDGGLTMLKICSFAVFFAIIGDAACQVARLFSGQIGEALTAAFCELTLAGTRCAAIGSTPGRLLCAFAIGYSGLSVHIQVSAVLSDSGISLSRYHVCKLIQGILCAVFIFLWSFF